MGVYNSSRYQVDSYGKSSQLEYYAEPFDAIAINYTQVQLTWVEPSGEYTQARLVRSNDGFPETAEDGEILWEWFEGDTFISSFLDGENTPVASGKFIYYRIWLRLLNGTWLNVGDSYTLVPIEHATLAPNKTQLVSSKNKFLDILPRIYTTSSESRTDEVSQDSDLARFLDAFSFELDRSLTYADLLLPLEAWKLVGPEILALQTLQAGLPLEEHLATKQQRRLTSQANFIYQDKGKRNGIEAYVESLTGFAPEVTVSPNILLTPQDSSFTKGLGFWTPVGNLSLQIDDSTPGPTTELYSVSNAHVAKVVVSTADSKIVSGIQKPVTQGIPVDSGLSYSFSGYVKTAASTADVSAKVSWYGLVGNSLGDPVSLGAAFSANTSWAKFDFNLRAPGASAPIIAYRIVEGDLSFLSDSVTSLTVGESIRVSGVSDEIDAEYEIVSIQDNGLSISVATELADTEEPIPVDGLYEEYDITEEDVVERAHYCLLELVFEDTGTLYLDLLQLAPSDVQEFHEARSVEIFLNPTKSNFLLNPGFNPTTLESTWDIDAEAFLSINREGTGSPKELPDGSAGLLALSADEEGYLLEVELKDELESTISSTTGVIPTGRFMTVSFYAKLAGLTEADLTSEIELKTFYENEEEEEEDIGLVTTDITITQTWARFSATLFVPEDSREIFARLTIRTTAEGETVYLDRAQIEPSFIPTDYFDGALPVPFGAVWEGDEYESTTHLYPNLTSKIMRLKEELPKYIPTGLTYLIRWYGGGVAKPTG
jgi:hypothetical protein